MSSWRTIVDQFEDGLTRGEVLAARVQPARASVRPLPPRCRWRSRWGYVNGCRCEHCCTAQRAYDRQRYARKRPLQAASKTILADEGAT